MYSAGIEQKARQDFNLTGLYVRRQCLLGLRITQSYMSFIIGNSFSKILAAGPANRVLGDEGLMQYIFDHL